MRDGDQSGRPVRDKVAQPIPAAEALSFLKEARGAAAWTDVLQIGGLFPTRKCRF
jgi:hypothetical protein